MTTTAGASKFFPKAQEGFTTTVSGSVAAGATTVGLNGTGNYTNGDTVVLIIDPGVSGKEQSFSGVIDTSGVQVTGVVWLSGTNTTHSSGATVVDYVAAGHIDLISAGALISHNADGTPKSGITYPASSFTTPTITDFTNATHTHASAAQGGSLNGGDAITDGTLTPAELVSGTGSTWVWQTYTPALTNVTTGNGTLTCKYIQIGKTVFARGVFTLGGTSSISGAVTIALPVTSSSTAMQASGSIIGAGVAIDSGVFAYPLDAVWASTTTMNLNARITITGSNPVYLDLNSNRQLSNTVPLSFGSADGFTWQIMYEAA